MVKVTVNLLLNRSKEFSKVLSYILNHIFHILDIFHLPDIVQREPWINVQILKEAWNFAEMLNMTTLIILAIVPSEIWSDTQFILSWKMWY